MPNPGRNDHRYDVHITSQSGLQVISVIAANDAEGIRKLRRVAGGRTIMADTLTRDGAKLPLPARQDRRPPQPRRD